eukprot:CAMPEP_0201867194 /NCGR_PEP_ID=MMETSP0902-20130614/1521_1 /ASSEMBLY_ACC=CAM_ASM_000551 /TAXON_ID=420261 /ORGANISM="Thalassiosira antarctica, Strain CCMP982" /LENGTH=323 /DNA_ID=CAMNT_0048392315 /DNA_START=62 /DNA_END=1033 /DNA_ORIENTATION=+
MKYTILASSILCSLSGETTLAFQPSTTTIPLLNPHRNAADTSSTTTALQISRRQVLSTSITGTIISAATASSILTTPTPANAADAGVQDSLAVNEFLRSGVDSGGNMGVSSQAGKSRPQTGVVFRDGTQVLQGKNGDVSAELLVGTKAQPEAVLVSFNAPYKLETGSVFDVECRDGKTGDGAFLAVTEPTNGKSLEELPSSFFLNRLFDPTGRFSFYGPPTDVKVKKSTSLDNDRRVLELTFSNLSQSTNAEIQRIAVVVATIPKGTDNAVMLVASSNAKQWRKGGAEGRARQIVDSFRAVPAPKTKMKLKAKDRTGGQSLDF